MARNLAELRADFRQFYGISADDIGICYSVSEAADLAVMLPRESRCAGAYRKENAWATEHYLLAHIANTLDLFVWAMSGSKTDKPELIYPPGTKKADGKKKETIVLTKEEYMEKLKRKRVDINGD